MKRRFILRMAALAFALAALTGTAQAADYYVVVGAFANEMNARRFTTDILSHFSNATYSFNAERNLFYVYVLKTSKKTMADERSHYLKTYKGFKDVWVLADHTDALKKQNSTAAKAKSSTARHKRGETTGAISAGTGTSKAVHTPRYEGASFLKGTGSPIASAAPGGMYLDYNESSAEARAAQLAWTTTSGLSFAAGIDDPSALAESEVADRIFTFVVENSEGKEIDAEVMLVDYERVKRIAGFRTGQHVAIRGAKRGQMVTLVCDVLGYGQETHRYNIDQLSRGRDIRKNEQGVWEVRFKLTKMELNEIAFLNKTTFHADAAVLKASSREELDDLAELMLDNPSYKIIVHSHCNRGDKREIKVPAEARYFELEGAVAMTGSDKKLTKARATIVKEYLVSKGIEGKRIGVVGWGSLEPMASPTGPDADLNERIEFELAGE